MATFYGIDSSSSKSFFSSMFSTSSSGSWYSDMSSLMGDYGAIRNGSYGKLLKSYYAQQKDDDSEKKTRTVDTSKLNDVLSYKTAKTTESTSKDTNASTASKPMVQISADANATKTAADALMTKGSDSVFRMKLQTDAKTGRTAYAYDSDKIYKAVKDLADSYNAMIKDAESVDNSSVRTQISSLIQKVNGYEDAFEDMGISIHADNSLSIDEETFKKADMNDVRTVFNGTNSLSSDIYQRAAVVETASKNAADTATTYNNNADVVSTLAGSLYNSYL